MPKFAIAQIDYDNDLKITFVDAADWREALLSIMAPDMRKEVDETMKEKTLEEFKKWYFDGDAIIDIQEVPL